MIQHKLHGSAISKLEVCNEGKSAPWCSKLNERRLVNACANPYTYSLDHQKCFWIKYLHHNKKKSIHFPGQLNPDLRHLTRQIMSMRELKKFIIEKNKSLKPTGQKICVNVKTAYQTNMVPITTTSNLLQDEILTHLVFDTGNSTKNCNKQIEERIQSLIKAHYKPPPIQWSNIEYVMPMTILFVLALTISITVNFFYCCRRQENSGPRRNNNFELVNTN